MALFPDPFDTLVNLQRTLDAFRTSNWLESGPSGGGAHPPLNVFRRGGDFIIIAEVPGVKKSDLNVEVKDNTIRISGGKSVNYPEKASLHRRERLSGRFDRAITVPVQIDPDSVRAECRDGILVLSLGRAEKDKPRSIKIG
jgi:HSP20 family protein